MAERTSLRIGDRVEHWAGPSGTGGNPNCYGATGVILEFYPGTRCARVMFDDHCLQANGGPINTRIGPWIVDRLRLIEIPYDASQQGDTDEDI